MFASMIELTWLAIFNTVNSEIFAMFLFLRNFAYVKFPGNKTLAKWPDHSVICW